MSITLFHFWGLDLLLWKGGDLIIPKVPDVSLSACVICYNEAQNIKRCLDSLKWVDELIVVDAMSTDDTVKIASTYTDDLYQRAWTGYVDQKNFALKKAKREWVLSVDADEQISPALKKEILMVIESPTNKAGYRIPRRSFYQGRWINHSGFYPDTQLRLFKRKSGAWTGGRVHERVAIDGEVGLLKNDLLHYPYGGGISGQLRTVNAFSGLLAEDMYQKGIRFHAMLLFSRPFFKFLEVYILKRGMLDGLPGLIIAVTSAYAMFVRYVKLREKESALGIQNSPWHND